MDKPSCRRISRLAQPRKYATPSSIRKRSTSEDKTPKNVTRRTDKRCQSASPLPLSRPPFIRSLAKEWTPIRASSPKNTTIGRKKNLKKQSARIVQVIRKKFGDNFLAAGLESMSAKQFVEIIKYFAKTIFEKKIIIQENNTDDVVHFVQLMEYPHQMNKSWLKTPTALGVYDRIVELMDWLCDFVTFDEHECIEDIVENVDVVTDISNTFSNKKCSFTLIRGIKENYSFWNEKKSEFDESKAKLIASLIYEKTQLNDIDSVIHRIKIQYESMLNIRAISEDDELLEVPQEIHAALVEEVNQLKLSVNEKEKKYKRTYHELYELTRVNKQLSKATERLNQIIDNQSVSVDDRQKMINFVEQNSVLVKQKRYLVRSIHLISNGHQERIGNLKKQRSNMIIHCNSTIQDLFRINGVIEFSDVTIEKLSIHEDDTMDHFKEKLQLLSDMKDMIIKCRQKNHASLNEAQETVKCVRNELNKVEDSIILQKSKIILLNRDIQIANDEIVDLSYSSEQEQNRYQNKIDALQMRLAENEAKIKTAEKQAEEIKSETGKIGDDIEAKANILLKVKEERQSRRIEAILQLQSITEFLKAAENSSK